MNGQVVVFPQHGENIQRLKNRVLVDHMNLALGRVASIMAEDSSNAPIETREQLGERLVQSMVRMLVGFNYRIGVNTIQACEYLARLISDSIRQYPGMFLTLTGDDVEKLRLPESDSFFLNYIYSLFREYESFQLYLTVQIQGLYEERANEFAHTDNTEVDSPYGLFIEVSNILQFVTPALIQTLEPFSVYPLEQDSTFTVRVISS